MNTFNRRRALQLGAAGVAVGLATRAPGQSTERQIEGGIGGTGIVGVLTEFGSLYINGNRVLVDDATVYTDGFGPLPANALRVGDSLTVEATGTPLNARRVHVTHPLVGAISEIDQNRIVVNGVQVALASAPRGFGQGDRVAVSGLWRGGMVEASGLSPARSAQDLVSGDLSHNGLRNFIGSVPVRGGGVGRTATASFVTAVGTYSEGQFIATTAIEGRFTGAAGPLERLSIEGYLEPIRQAPGYRISGLGHSFDRNLQLAPFAEGRVLFSGPYTGAFVAQEAVILPNSAAQRKRLLRQMANR